MTRKVLVTLSGSLLSISGLIILGMAGNAALMGLFGSQVLPPPQAGEPGWVGVAFARVFGAALASLGFVMLAARQLSDGSARAIGGALLGGLALLTLVTLIQAEAIWTTPAGWALAGVIMLACVGAVGLRQSGSLASAQ